jgi:[NiFe] hydrogenase diaphorase moiety small subunit
MSETITLFIDGVKVQGHPGQTIMEAAEVAGIYIPRLCYAKELVPGGNCRVCTVKVQGRHQAACVYPIAKDMDVEANTDEMNALRKRIVEMLFVEGNHFCMFCEKSGNCELQAMGYRLGITTPRYPYLFPKRGVEASHPDFYMDGNRCIRCGRCVRASRTVDGKSAFGFVNRGSETRIAPNSATGFAGTDLSLADRAASVCPVGTIIKKRVGFAVPFGRRLYDHEPIGSEVEAPRGNPEAK